jgi:hypothetical protein
VLKNRDQFKVNLLAYWTKKKGFHEIWWLLNLLLFLLNKYCYVYLRSFNCVYVLHRFLLFSSFTANNQIYGFKECCREIIIVCWFKLGSIVGATVWRVNVQRSFVSVKLARIMVRNRNVVEPWIWMSHYTYRTNMTVLRFVSLVHFLLFLVFLLWQFTSLSFG